MADISWSVFPKDRCEALAMLYLQNQDLKGLTPSQIQEKYFSAIKELHQDYSDNHSSYSAKPTK